MEFHARWLKTRVVT